MFQSCALESFYLIIRETTCRPIFSLMYENKQMEHWAAELNNAIDGLSFGVVAKNNHYAGFGPESVNIFRRLLGCEERKFGRGKRNSQTFLQDFE